MIYTITTNPSLDYYLCFDKEISSVENNRSTKEFFDAGGKGVNVSIFLNSLGIQSACLGFLGGFTKDFYLSYLKKFRNIQPLFTNIDDNSRINIKALGPNNVSLNALGPHISDEEYNKFIARASKIYDDDYIVLSGSIQPELHDKLIQLVGSLTSGGTRVILDTDLDLTDKCLTYNPYCVKLNSENTGVNEEEIVAKGKDLISKGAACVLYSSPINKNYYFIYDAGVYKCTRDKDIKALTGSGDAMIAGFLFSRIRGANPKEAFKYAVASSMNLTLSDEVLDRDVIENEVNRLEVTDL